MKLPDWLKPLGKRDETARANAGLTPKKDGWYKWVAGKVRYICKPCPVAEVVGKLDARVAAIMADVEGRTVPVAVAGLTLEALAELYVAWLKQRLTTGLPKKLARRTYDDILQTLDLFVDIVGPNRLAETIGPDDFSKFSAARFVGKAPSTIRREIIYIEAFANWAAPGSRKAGHLQRPWRFGADFRKPSDDEIATSAADSDKAYTPKQLRTAFLTVKDRPHLRAAGWLALCAAMQPKDLGLLPEANVDLDKGLVTFARGKTAVGRMAWLPPCAVVAVRKYVATRPTGHGPAKGLLFVTSNGQPYYRDAEGDEPGGRYDSLGNQWSKVTGLPISGLRSTFATIADDDADQRAVDVIMGHKAGHFARKVRSKHYAKRFDPDRVKRVVSRVVVLAFGRKLRAPQPAVVAQASPAQPSAGPNAPAATPDSPTPKRDTGAAKPQGSVRPSRAARRSGSKP